nr:immunoglobulin light chain junction region [Macaca mulatta]MOV37242.1 immunoglobulin light chain junction region [Macaca mulatta]MOV37524.1 immunoglobulin light chain junction region [Macaca mulatta]
CQKCSYSPCTF